VNKDLRGRKPIELNVIRSKKLSKKGSSIYGETVSRRKGSHRTFLRERVGPPLARDRELGWGCRRNTLRGELLSPSGGKGFEGLSLYAEKWRDSRWRRSG